MEPVVGIEQPMPKFGPSFDRKPTPIKRTHPNSFDTLQYMATEGFTEGPDGAVVSGRRRRSKTALANDQAARALAAVSEPKGGIRTRLLPLLQSLLWGRIG